MFRALATEKVDHQVDYDKWHTGSESDLLKQRDIYGNGLRFLGLFKVRS